MCFSIWLLEVVVAVLGRGQRWAEVGRGGQVQVGTSWAPKPSSHCQLAQVVLGRVKRRRTHFSLPGSCGLTFSNPRSEVRVLQELSEEKRGGCDADVRRAVEPGAHLPGDCGIRQDLAQRWDF